MYSSSCLSNILLGINVFEPSSNKKIGVKNWSYVQYRYVQRTWVCIEENTCVRIPNRPRRVNRYWNCLETTDKHTKICRYKSNKKKSLRNRFLIKNYKKKSFGTQWLREFKHKKRILFFLGQIWAPWIRTFTIMCQILKWAHPPQTPPSCMCTHIPHPLFIWEQ